MGISMSAYAGDQAGQTLGRQPYRALVTVDHSGEDFFPLGLYKPYDLDGTPWYMDVSATCLTPGAWLAMVTRVEKIGAAFSLEVAPMKLPRSKEIPWQPGVHLFSIMVAGQAAGAASAIATVVVPPKSKPIELSELGVGRILERNRQWAASLRGAEAIGRVKLPPG